MQLPEPDHTSQTVAMEIMVVQYKSCAGFLHYKVLRVSKPQGPSEKKIQYYFELFDFAASDSSWKEVGCVKLPCCQIHRGQVVLVDATFHWLFKTLENNYRFLAFNMEIDESLGRHNVDRYNMPKKVNEDAIHAGSGKSCYKLMDYKGKLGLIHHVIGKASCMSLEIWVMVHYVNKKEAVWNMVKSYIEGWARSPSTRLGSGHPSRVAGGGSGKMSGENELGHQNPTHRVSGRVEFGSG
ncbi:hypothetical protein Sjap_000915 [Stephania japonica]|uniref:F-box protein n=1 Tax=Stephania japonica TaxID=461633 RepID=A0AAP0KLJ1_9MAGN